MKTMLLLPFLVTMVTSTTTKKQKQKYVYHMCTHKHKSQDCNVQDNPDIIWFQIMLKLRKKMACLFCPKILIFLMQVKNFPSCGQLAVYHCLCDEFTCISEQTGHTDAAPVLKVGSPRVCVCQRSNWQQQ